MEMPYLLGALAGLTVISLIVVAVQARLAGRVRNLEQHGAGRPRRSGSRVAAEPSEARPGEPATAAAGSEWPPLSPSADPRALGVPAGTDSTAAMAGQLELLARQLELLDDLEKREDRENQLAVLFEVDNLTLRLRRGAESALVLAGAVPERRSPEHLTASSALRAACAQIEGYARVVVEAQVDPLIHADHIAALTHVLAELLDNATRHARSDAPVTARVESRPDGVGLVISDAGPGMDAATLSSAQDALAGRARPGTGSGNGLLVAGLQAGRLGSTVGLTSGPTGTVVTVTVPAALFVQTPADPAGTPRAGTVHPTEGGTGAPAPLLPDPAPVRPAPTPELAYVGGDASTGASQVTRPTPQHAIEAPAVHSFGAETTFEPVPAAPPSSAPAPSFDQPGPTFAPVSSGFESLPSAPQPAAPALPPLDVLPTPQPAAFAPEVSFDPAPRHDALPTPAPAPEDGWIVPAGAGASATASASVRDEVLAELSRLSGYAPAPPAVNGGGDADLQGRTPSPAPELQPVGSGPESRDPENVRSRFSSFRSGVGRGRRSR
jgi:signal transduction histidine kinase